MNAQCTVDFLSQHKELTAVFQLCTRVPVPTAVVSVFVFVLAFVFVFVFVLVFVFALTVHRTEHGVPLCTGVPRYVLRLLAQVNFSPLCANNLEKYNLQLGEIQFIIWTNTFCYLDKLIFKCTICAL